MRPAGSAKFALLRGRPNVLHVTLRERAERADMASAPTGPSRDRVRGYRERLRRQGLRPIQIWVPDTRSPNFAVEAHRQSAAIAASPHETDDQAFIDAISDSAER